MNLLDTALRKEKDKDYLSAIRIYEEIIANVDAPKESFINLSFIYWELAAEFAFRDANNIPDKWGIIGGEKYLIVLKKGLLNYPYNVELHFWSKYFPHRLYFGDFSPEECLKLIEKFGDKDSIVPYFFLYLFDPNRYNDKRNVLLIECEKTPTAKNDYIKSIIK